MASSTDTVVVMTKPLLATIVALATLTAAPAAAEAADTIIVPDVQAHQMTALKDNVVWVNSDRMLMRRDSEGRVMRVPGAPVANYRSTDLGLTGSGRLVLTYLRCGSNGRCQAYSDNLAGRRSRYRRLAPRRCKVSTAPSRWRQRVAYGLDCDKLAGRAGVHDARRSGLFVRKGSGAAKRLRLPPRPTWSAASIERLNWVDLRGTTVGAVGGDDVVMTAFSQTVNRSRLRSQFVAGSEGLTVEWVRGMALGSGQALWTLAHSIHEGDPNVTKINRLGADGCASTEPITSTPGPGPEYGPFAAGAMAVDGRTMYLYLPGTGIVTHDFDPTRSCR